MNNERLEKIEKRIEEVRQMTSMEDLGLETEIDRELGLELNMAEGKEKDLVQEYNETKDIWRREEVLQELESLKGKIKSIKEKINKQQNERLEEKKKEEIEKLEAIKTKVVELLDRQNDLNEKITENEQAISEKEEEIKKILVSKKKAEKEQESYENTLKTMVKGELNVNDVETYRLLMKKNEEKIDSIVAQNESIKKELKELESLKEENESLKKAYAYIEEELAELDEEFSLKVQEEPVVEEVEIEEQENEIIDEEKQQGETATEEVKQEPQVAQIGKAITQDEMERLMAGESIDGFSQEESTSKILTPEEIEELLTGKSVEESSQEEKEESVQPKQEPTVKKVEPEQPKKEPVVGKVAAEEPKQEPATKKAEPKETQQKNDVKASAKVGTTPEKENNRIKVKAIKEVGLRFENGIPYYYIDLELPNGALSTSKFVGFDKIHIMNKEEISKMNEKDEAKPKDIAEAEKYYDMGMAKFLAHIDKCYDTSALAKYKEIMRRKQEIYEISKEYSKNKAQVEANKIGISVDPRKVRDAKYKMPFDITYDFSELYNGSQEKENKAKLYWLKRIAKANSKLNVAEYKKEPNLFKKIWHRIKNNVQLLSAGEQSKGVMGETEVRSKETTPEIVREVFFQMHKEPGFDLESFAEAYNLDSEAIAEFEKVANSKAKRNAFKAQLEVSEEQKVQKQVADNVNEILAEKENEGTDLDK